MHLNKMKRNTLKGFSKGGDVIVHTAAIQIFSVLLSNAVNKQFLREMYIRSAHNFNVCCNNEFSKLQVIEEKL